jgi:hypothetical protein
MCLTVSYEPHNLLNHSGRTTVQVVSQRSLAPEAQVGLGLSNVARDRLISKHFSHYLPIIITSFLSIDSSVTCVVRKMGPVDA